LLSENERKIQIINKFTKSTPVHSTKIIAKQFYGEDDLFNKFLRAVETMFGIYKNKDSGWDILFNKASIRNTLTHRTGIGKAAMLFVVPQIIETGIFLETTKRNKYGLLSHIFVSKVIQDGEEYAVGFTVREDVNGKRYYNHQLTEMSALAIPEAPGGEVASADNIPGSFRSKDSRTPSDDCAHQENVRSIVQKYLSVKPSSEKEEKTSRL
jgi:hypothetical protein